MKAEKEEECRFLMHMAVGSLSRGSEEEEEVSKTMFLYHCLGVSKMLGLSQEVYDNDDGLAALQETANEFQLSQAQTSKKPYKGLNLMSMPKEMVSKEEHEHEMELDKRLIEAMYYAESLTHGCEPQGPLPKPKDKVEDMRRLAFVEGPDMVQVIGVPQWYKDIDKEDEEDKVIVKGGYKQADLPLPPSKQYVDWVAEEAEKLERLRRAADEKMQKQRRLQEREEAKMERKRLKIQQLKEELERCNDPMILRSGTKIQQRT